MQRSQRTQSLVFFSPLGGLCVLCVSALFLVRLFVAEGFDGVQAGRFVGGVQAKN